MDENQEKLFKLWLLRYHDNDLSVMDEMIEYFAKPLSKQIERLLPCKEEGRDVLQIVWLKAMNRLGEVSDAKKLNAWFHSLAHHTAVDWFRKHNKRYCSWNAVIDQMNQNHPSNEHGRLIQELDLEEVLQKLTTDHRQVIKLYYMEELDIGEIAKITGVAEGTVKSRLHYARKLLMKDHGSMSLS